MNVVGFSSEDVMSYTNMTVTSFGSVFPTASISNFTSTDNRSVHSGTTINSYPNTDTITFYCSRTVCRVSGTIGHNTAYKVSIKVNGTVVSTYNGASIGSIGSCSSPRTQSLSTQVTGIKGGDNIVVIWDDTSA